MWCTDSVCVRYVCTELKAGCHTRIVRMNLNVIYFSYKFLGNLSASFMHLQTLLSDRKISKQELPVMIRIVKSLYWSQVFVLLFTLWIICLGVLGIRGWISVAQYAVGKKMLMYIGKMVLHNIFEKGEYIDETN